MILEISKKKLDKSDEIAIHHGFSLARIKPTYTKKKPFLLPDEKECVVKNFKKKNFKLKEDEPLLVYYDKPVLLNRKENIPRNYKILGFDIIGVSNSVAEAMLINTATRILKEEGYKNIFIDVNSTGGRNSIAKFTDEIIAYYKKNLNCKCRIDRKNPFFINCEHDEYRTVKDNAPRPINFLTEQSQQHFKEFLEYIEEMDIPYRINGDLIVEKNHYSKTIFEIKVEEKGKEIVLARGGRYDESVNKVAHRRNLSAVGLSLQFRKIKNSPAYSNRINGPSVFLVQFGFKAKLRSFEVIDMLRQQHITVYQNLHKNRLTDQFDEAKKIGVPYVIIIGHKEAIDDEIIFRDMIKATHDVIKTKNLPRFLKKVGLIH